MRTLVFLCVGFGICWFGIHPTRTETPVVREIISRTPGELSSIISQGEFQFHAETQEVQKGKFPNEIMTMLHVMMPDTLPGFYTEFDSSNTRVFWLTSFSSPFEVVLVETFAGYGTGSCGANIYAGQYDSDNEIYTPMLNTECGAVDTVLSISHNGIMDFCLTDKWGIDHYYYRFNGKELVGYNDPNPHSVLSQITDLICEHDSIYDPEPYDFNVNYVDLQPGGAPYVTASYSLDGIFIMRVNSAMKVQLVTYLEYAEEFDVQEICHNGMHDIRTFDLDYKYSYYQWDGRKYVRDHTEKWVCPE